MGKGKGTKENDKGDELEGLEAELEEDEGGEADVAPDPALKPSELRAAAIAPTKDTRKAPASVKVGDEVRVRFMCSPHPEPVTDAAKVKKVAKGAGPAPLLDLEVTRAGAKRPLQLVGVRHSSEARGLEAAWE
jgi:hypothetical protein